MIRDAYPVVCKGRKAGPDPSLRMPVSKGHVCNKEEDDSEEDGPANNLSCLPQRSVST